MLMLIFLLLVLPTILQKYFANQNVKYKCNPTKMWSKG
jgi:hypothetical protein